MLIETYLLTTAAATAARSVNADTTLTVNVLDAQTFNTLARGGSQASITETAQLFYAQAGNRVTREWSAVLSLVAGVPQTLDLLSLATPAGGVETFTNIAFVYAYATGSNPVKIGNAGSNPWLPGWSGSTHVETLPAGSRYFKESPLAPWQVDATHRYLMFDSGSLASTCRVILVGN